CLPLEPTPGDVRITDMRLILMSGFFSYRAGHQVEPIGKSAGIDRAKIMVTNGKGVCKGIIKWNILSGVIAHGQGEVCVFFLAPGFFCFQPLVMFTSIAGIDLIMSSVG